MMQVSAISNSFTFNNFQNGGKLSSTQIDHSVSQIYKPDFFSISTTEVPPEIKDPPPPPEIDPTPWYKDPAVWKLAGMSVGAGAVVGTMGYFVGNALGSAALGATIGAGIGIVAPVAMIIYALKSWG